MKKIITNLVLVTVLTLGITTSVSAESVTPQSCSLVPNICNLIK